MDNHRADEEHQRILDEVLREQPPSSRPRNGSQLLIGVLALAVLLAMVLWAVPGDALGVRAKVRDVPRLAEVVSADLTVPQRPDTRDIDAFVATTPAVKLVAARVGSAVCKAPDERCYAGAMYYFVRDNVVYLDDPVDEYYETPEETLLAGAADCDGQAILLASLMQAVGVVTRFRYTPGHVAVEAYVPTKNVFDKPYVREWVVYDATCKECRAP